MNKLKKILLLLTMVGALVLALLYWLLAPRQEIGVTEQWEAQNASSTAKIDHGLWQQVLDDYLINDDPSGVALFDYQGLVDDGGEALSEYLSHLSLVEPVNLNRAEQFAYWVNLYNALTVEVIADHYPVESIKEIGSSPLPTGPWNEPLITVAGKSLTLNQIEHSILRPIWQDYRIHFVVNCASIGCPNLQAQAFTAMNNERLLDKSAIAYLTHPRGINLEGEQLTLSSIFNWYSADFGNSDVEVLQTLSAHLPEPNAAMLRGFSGSIAYDYDWRLNGLGEE